MDINNYESLVDRVAILTEKNEKLRASLRDAQTTMINIKEWLETLKGQAPVEP